MQRFLVSLCVAAIGAVLVVDLGPPGPARPPRIGAHYYPWYTAECWASQPTANTPVLGRYASADRAVPRRQIQWAKEAGIDFFLLSGHRSAVRPAGSAVSVHHHLQ
jgi:hypothetical protein